MDIESRLQRLEAEVHRTRTLVWVVLAIVLAVTVGLLRAIDSAEFVVSVGVVLALLATAHLLVSAVSGLRRFGTGRDKDAQLQERILREFSAERAKTPGPGSNP